MKLLFLTKCCWVRRSPGVNVPLVLMLLVLLSSTYFLVDDKLTVANSKVVSPLWILPDMSSDSRGSPRGSPFKVPDNWTIFIPKRHSNITNCDECYNEDDLNIIPEWSREEEGDSKNLTLLKGLYQKIEILLFFINHGAVGILLTSHLSTVNSSLSRLIIDNLPNGVVGLEYSGQQLTTDSFHFHHKMSITHETPCQYRLRKRMNPFWTVGVRCKSISYGNADTQTTVLTDPHAPPIFSSRPKFSIDKYSDAFFDYEGFWALFATLFPAGTRTNRWSLWAQRMLQEIHGEMALTSLTCPETRVPTSVDPTPDKITTSIHAFVATWQCGYEKSFYDCATLLAKDFSKSGFVDDGDVKLLKVWFDGLRDSGYPEPKRNFKRTREGNYLHGCVIHSPALVQSPSGNTSLQRMFPNIYPLCKNLPRRKEVVYPFADYEIIKPSKVRDIALVVIFYDSSIYSNIRFLQDIYGKYFPYLIYCGPDWNLFQVFYKTFQTPLTYIEVPNTQGFVAYECVSRAIMMNYDVSGYLEMADDVILNTWTLGQIPRDKFWFQKDLKIASRHQQMMQDFALPYPFPWWPWTVHGQVWGAKAMARVWNRFKHILLSQNDTRSKQIVRAFLETLRYNSGNTVNFFYSSSDIFYVPNKFRQEWSWLSDIFFSSHVFLDIAVPTLMNGMDWTKNIIRMEGLYLWYNNRGNYPMYYRDFHQFFHPWKMGWIHRSDHANFLCYHVLPHIVTDRTNATLVI